MESLDPKKEFTAAIVGNLLHKECVTVLKDHLLAQSAVATNPEYKKFLSGAAEYMETNAKSAEDMGANMLYDIHCMLEKNKTAIAAQGGDKASKKRKEKG